MANSGAGWAALGLDRRVYVLGSAGLVRSIGRSATFVFLPLVFADVYHLPFLFIGLLVAAVVPVSTLSFLVGGHLSDRFGRLPFAVFPSFLSAVAMVLLWIELDQGVLLVMVLWGFNALLNGLSRPAQSAMIGDVTRPELTVTAYGVQRVFTNTGFAISPAVGGFLAAFSGLPALFLFAAITSAIEGIVLVTFLRETYHGAGRAAGTALRSVAAPFHDRLFVWLLLVLAGLSLLMNQFGTPLALYLGAVRSVSYTEFGLIYALNGVLVVLLQLPIGRLVERRGKYLLWMAVGTLAYGASFLLF
ncbi:MAG: MFS transporter, partial [Thermoplasmata archaeon]